MRGDSSGVCLVADAISGDHEPAEPAFTDDVGRTPTHLQGLRCRLDDHHDDVDGTSVQPHDGAEAGLEVGDDDKIRTGKLPEQLLR